MFNWKDYYTSAQEMSELAPDSDISEAYLRNTISRAYYSSFCLARNQLRREGINITPGGSVHIKVSLAYLNSTNATCHDVGENLAALHLLRKFADYEDTIRRLARKARRALSLAEAILADLDSIS